MATDRLTARPEAFKAAWTDIEAFIEEGTGRLSAAADDDSPTFVLHCGGAEVS